MQTLVDRFGKSVRLRGLNRKKFKQEMETLRDIFNDAWSDNWGFVPFTREEFAELGTSLRLFVPDDFIRIAEYQGKPVAFIVILPNLNEVLRDLDGNLFPSGLFKLINALRKRRIRTCRIPLMGVRKELQNTPLGIALALLVVHNLRQPVIGRGMEGSGNVMDTGGQPGNAQHPGKVWQQSCIRLTGSTGSSCNVLSTKQKIAVLLLAGSRSGSDEVARVAGVSCKALAPLAGIPMIVRVLDALQASGRIASYVLCGPAPGSHQRLPGVAAVHRGGQRHLGSPQQAVSAAVCKPVWPG